MFTALYGIRDLETGETYFCNVPSCQSNLFQKLINGNLVCNRCEEPPQVRAGSVLIPKGSTQINDKVYPE